MTTPEILLSIGIAIVVLYGVYRYIKHRKAKSGTGGGFGGGNGGGGRPPTHEK